MAQSVPFIVGVGGFSSNVGKTTLVCDLLRALPGWEAVKITRGHYRSCGKDARACCVSHLLKNEPVLRSGRSETYTPGKDTGRYWDAGASNVHWVIVTEDQVKQGITLALSRVRAPGVIVEGTSFWQFVRPDLALLAARADGGTVKKSARRVWPLADGVYLGDADEPARENFRKWLAEQKVLDGGKLPPCYGAGEVARLVAEMGKYQMPDGRCQRPNRSEPEAVATGGAVATAKLIVP